MSLSANDIDHAMSALLMNTDESLRDLIHTLHVALPEMFPGGGPVTAGINVNDLPAQMFPYGGEATLPIVNTDTQFTNVPGGVPFYNEFGTGQGPGAKLYIIGPSGNLYDREGRSRNNTYTTWIGGTQNHNPPISPQEVYQRARNFFLMTKKPLTVNQLKQI